MDPVKEAISELLLAPQEALLYGSLKAATLTLRDAELAFKAEQDRLSAQLNEGEPMKVLRAAQATYKQALEAFNQHIAPVGS